MKHTRLLAVTLFAGAALLASCGGSGSKFPSHDGKYDTKSNLNSVEDWGHSLGNAQGLLGKKVSFTYTENIEVKVNANGGTADFSNFRTKTTVTTEGYIDFSATDFYGYVKTNYQDANNPKTNYVKEGLIRKAASGDTYEMITTADSEYTSLGNVYAAFGAAFTLTQVGNTKATKLDSSAFIFDSNVQSWLYKNVGLSSTAGNREEDWEDVKPTVGQNAAGELVVKSECPIIGYTTDQGVSDFGASVKEAAAYSQVKVGTDGYITDWAVDYNGENAKLDFAIMTIPPTVIVTGGRSMTANYNAAAQEHKEDIEHAQPAAKKYATYSVKSDCGVASYTITRMIMGSTGPTGMYDITLEGKDEVVENLWFAIKPELNQGVDIVSVKVGDQETICQAGFYCIKVAEEGNYEFTVVTDDVRVGIATCSVVKTEAVTEAVVKELTAPAFTVMTPVTIMGTEIGDAKYMVVKPVLAEGKEIDHVLCNGIDITATAAGFGGYYGVNIKTAGLYEFIILTK